MDRQGMRYDRREALRRAAIAGGALVWMAPAVQRVAAGPTFAATSPPPDSSTAGRSAKRFGVPNGRGGRGREYERGRGLTKQ